MKIRWAWTIPKGTSDQRWAVSTLEENFTLISLRVSGRVWMSRPSALQSKKWLPFNFPAWLLACPISPSQVASKSQTQQGLESSLKSPLNKGRYGLPGISQGFFELLVGTSSDVKFSPCYAAMLFAYLASGALTNFSRSAAAVTANLCITGRLATKNQATFSQIMNVELRQNVISKTYCSIILYICLFATAA